MVLDMDVCSVEPSKAKLVEVDRVAGKSGAALQHTFNLEWNKYGDACLLHI